MQGYPGQIHANIGPVKTNVTFDHRDCGVTLLKNDHVLINLLVDMVTGKRRAANIKPKIPFTFSYTKEKRELVTHLFAERPSRDLASSEGPQVSAQSESLQVLFWFCVSGHHHLSGS